MDFSNSSDEEEFFEIEKFQRPKTKTKKSNSDFFVSKKKKTERETDQPIDLTQELPVLSTSFQIEGIPVLFPFTPYPSQLQIMAKIIAVLQAPKENLLVESPTGTGKTMVLLCATLAWQQSLLSNSIFPAKKKGTEKDSQEDRDAIPRIYYCSRTHKQLNQVIAELKRSPYRPRMTILGSRSKMCLNERALKQHDVNQACTDLMRGISLEKDSEGSKVSKKEKCCDYFKRATKMADRFGSRVHDIEDLIAEGREIRACPYFASRELSQRADIIFTPYNYIIDPFIRQAVGIKLENAIVIIDEAHNVEDMSRESGSLTLTTLELSAIDSELIGLTLRKSEHPESEYHEFLSPSNGLFQDQGLDKNFDSHHQLQRLVQTVIGFMSDVKTWDVYEFERKIKLFKEHEISSFLASKSITKELVLDLSKKVACLVEQNNQPPPPTPPTKDNQEAKTQGQRILSPGSCRALQKLLFVIELIICPAFGITDLLPEAHDGYVMAISQCQPKTFPNSSKSRKTLSNEPIIELSFWLLNPSIIFQKMTKLCKSVILTSGSLSPLQSFQSELGTKFACSFEAPHIIAPSQVWAGVIASSPRGLDLTGTFKCSESFEYQDELAESIINLIQIAPFGTLCFFPSFLFLDKLIKRWKSSNAWERIERIKRIFIEPRNASSTEDFDNILTAYYQCIEQERAGAIFFAVFRGKASEGINFTDDYARLVISIGIPYPNFKDTQVDMKKRYNDKNHRSKRLIDGNEWYEIQAYRALNQALGRCIRHKDDWGAVVLLESRFTTARSHNFLSKWIRESLKSEGASRFSTQFASIRDFFSQKHSIPSPSVYGLGIFPTKSVKIGCPSCKSLLLSCVGVDIADFDLAQCNLPIPDLIRQSKDEYYCISTHSLSPDFDVHWDKTGKIDGCEYESVRCRRCPPVREGTIVQLADAEETFLIKRSFLM